MHMYDVEYIYIYTHTLTNTVHYRAGRFVSCFANSSLIFLLFNTTKTYNHMFV